MTDIEFFGQGIDGRRYADDDGRSAPPGMSTDEVADTGRDVSPSADDGRPGMTGSWVRMDHFYWPAPQAGPPAPYTPGGAPRVGGHAQGRGHEQQQSAALSL